jgi:hypothetical protein
VKSSPKRFAATASPFCRRRRLSWNLLLVSGAVASHDLSSLRVITYGTEPMPDSLLARLKSAFPQARFIQTFGTNETGIVRDPGSESDSAYLRFEDPMLEWKIVEDELWFRQPHADRGLSERGATNVSPRTAGSRTGDKVGRGPNATLRVLGRMGEMVDVGGENSCPPKSSPSSLPRPGVTIAAPVSDALTGRPWSSTWAGPGADQEASRGHPQRLPRTPRPPQDPDPVPTFAPPAQRRKRMKKVR